MCNSAIDYLVNFLVDFITNSLELKMYSCKSSVVMTETFTFYVCPWIVDLKNWVENLVANYDINKSLISARLTIIQLNKK